MRETGFTGFGSRSLGGIVATALVVGMTGAAQAGTFTATELTYDNALLSQFNLVNLNNYTTTNETEGRVIVGGNAAFNSATNVCFAAGCSGSATKLSDGTGAKYGALTVFGSLSGSVSLGNNGGDIYVGGNDSAYTNLRGKGTMNVYGSSSGATVDSATTTRTAQSSFAGRVQNGPAAQVNQSLAAVFPFSTANTNAIMNLASGIAALPGSPGVSAQALPTGNNIFFTANNDYTAGGKHYGVVTTTLANLASETNFGGINNNGNDATLVIVTGDGANYTLPNLNSYANANKVIFDFVNATTLKFGGAWSGSILAPMANITQQGGVLDGSVVVASINQTMELHENNLFTGDLTGLASTAAVPEPASLTIFGLGAGAAALIRRRRAKK